MHSPRRLHSDARRCLDEMTCVRNTALKERLARRAARLSELADRLDSMVRPGSGRALIDANLRERPHAQTDRTPLGRRRRLSRL
jgi:hypothetical protein